MNGPSSQCTKLLCIFKTVCLIRTIALHIQKCNSCGVNVFFCTFKKIIVVIENIFFEVSVNHYALAMLSTQQGKQRCSLFKNIDGTFQNWNATDAKDTHLQTRKVKIEMLLKKKYTLEKSKIHYHQVKLFFHQVKLSFSSSQIVFFIKSSRLFHQVKLSFSSSQIVFFIKSNGRFHQVKLSFSSSQIVFLVFSSSQIVFFVFHFLNFLFRYA